MRRHQMSVGFVYRSIGSRYIASAFIARDSFIILVCVRAVSLSLSVHLFSSLASGPASVAEYCVHHNHFWMGPIISPLSSNSNGHCNCNFSAQSLAGEAVARPGPRRLRHSTNDATKTPRMHRSHAIECRVIRLNCAGLIAAEIWNLVARNNSTLHPAIIGPFRLPNFY